MCNRESERTGRQLEEIALCDAETIILAERELTAFAGAVTDLFGPEQSSLSVAEWIDELESLDCPANPAALDFRRVTAAAAARLAHRQLSPQFTKNKIEASHT